MKWHFDYDKNGNTTAVKNGETSAISTFTYDKADKLKTASNGQQTVEYDYSATETLTNIKGISNSTSFSQRFDFDQADQLKSWYRNGGIQGAYEYFPTGEPQQRRYVNGVHTNYTYDDAQQMKTLKVTKGTTVQLDETIEYDLNGNVKSVISSSGNKEFVYDKADQLESQTIDSAQLTESYTYDKVGNRLTKNTVKNGTNTSISYTYDANNRLKEADGKAYSYDDNGNRTKDSKYTYIYNKFDQLIEIKTNTGTSIATFKYDAEGRRISKTVGGKTTNYHYDQGINVLFETDGTGNITAEYIYDPDGFPVTMTKGGQNYYYMYNSLKEITGLTNSSGTVVASYTYDAWGNILAQSGSMAAENPIRYKGYRYDETGLYYLIARYYQPIEGVFLTLDPEAGDTDDPKTQNGYAYANNNPVMMTDPDGNYAWAVINTGFAAYDGYKAYKAGKASGKKGWALARSVAWAAGSNYLKVGNLKKAGKAVKAVRETTRWKHIQNNHGPKSNKVSKDGIPKSKFKSNRTMKKTTRAAARKKPTGVDKYGNDVHEKSFRRSIGTTSDGKKSYRVKVIKKNGKIITSFPI